MTIEDRAGCFSWAFGSIIGMYASFLLAEQVYLNLSENILWSIAAWLLLVGPITTVFSIPLGIFLAWVANKITQKTR